MKKMLMLGMTVLILSLAVISCDKEEEKCRINCMVNKNGDKKTGQHCGMEGCLAYQASSDSSYYTSYIGFCSCNN